MRLIIRTADNTPGHLVEAGLDDFEVLPVSPFLNVPGIERSSGLSMMPNPSDGRFMLMDDAHGNGTVRVTDVQGRKVMSDERMVNGVSVIDAYLSPGIYIVHLLCDNGVVRTVRAVIR